MSAMKMADGGRVVVPAEIRRALGLSDGDAVTWELRDGEARLIPRRERVRRAQALVSGQVPPAISLASQLLAERRAEAADGTDG
jgi:AbrB family looped-hinge helix DNA binding protein